MLKQSQISKEAQDALASFFEPRSSRKSARQGFGLSTAEKNVVELHAMAQASAELKRLGYMVDWAQGSKAGNRSPWLFAADYACPAFRDPSVPRRQPDFSGMAGQTYRFVAKVLKSKQ